MHPDQREIAVLDFGSQYTHLIARRIRELGIMSRIYPPDTPAAFLTNAGAMILSGGPRSVVREPVIPHDPRIFMLGIPILGLCYGHQLMAHHFGGTVVSGAAREYGIATIKLQATNYKLPTLFHGVRHETVVWMSHGDHVEKLPKNFIQIATTGNRSIAAMADRKRRFYGFQFHPEVAHTKEGKKMLANFLFRICKLKKNWTADTMLQSLEAGIRREARDKNVFLLVSGGVDSTVCFALLEKVLSKDRIYGLHVDTGFMRDNETQNIRHALAKIGFDNLHIVRAERRFLAALRGITDPEEKRKIIGNLFLDITEETMKKLRLDGNWLLGQGTIYPDTIESGGTAHADKIKTHHNRVDRIHDMIRAGRIIEPLKDLYKDEVREIGLALGIPKELVFRHPFPGPGLAIRCLCSQGSESHANDELYECTNILKLPIKSVGVQGDERSYAHPAVIPKRHVHLAPEITNAFKNINRVLFLVAGEEKKLSASTVAKAYCTKKRLELLRALDLIVHHEVDKHPFAKKIWQMPVVLIPFGHRYHESIVIRPVQSKEAMTVAWAKIPDATLKKIAKKIMALRAIDFVFFDVTNKPPGTIEWE